MFFKWRRHSIKRRILYWASVCILITIVVNTAFFYTSSKNEALVAARKSTEIAAKNYSRRVSGELSKAMSVSQSLSLLLKSSIENGDIEITRDEVNSIFKEHLAENPKFIGVSVAFEPDAFDSEDLEFSGEPIYYENGRFATYYTRDSGKIVQEALKEVETSDYYIVPKQTLSNSIVEPYIYEAAGREILMTTCLSPIVVDGTFYGVVGVDIGAQFMQEMVSQIESDVEFNEIHIISGEGNVLASSSKMGSRTASGDLREDMQFNDGNSHFNFDGGMLKLYEPIEIEGADVNWMIVLSIDDSQIMNEVSGLFARQAIIALILLVVFLGIFNFAALKISRPIKNLSLAMEKFDATDLEKFERLNVDTEGLQEAFKLKKSYKKIISELKSDYEKRELANWFIKGQAELNRVMHEQNDFQSLSNIIISSLVKHVDAQVGAFFVQEDKEYMLTASYAYSRRKTSKTSYGEGDGIVGQAALEKTPIVIENAPDDYMSIASGTGQASPRSIAVIPCSYKGDVNCIMEIASFSGFSELQIEYLKEASNSIAIAINTMKSHSKTQDLLQKTEAQAQELQVQQEELRVSNEELEEQTRALQRSEQELQAQQEELRVVNEELEEQKNSLMAQNHEIEQKNTQLEIIRADIESKAKELSLASKYKSEFLANMSHELRTPLNSILILSEILKENKSGNLSRKQIEFASTINSSGADLLQIINDILDLSKVEAGKTQVNMESLNIKMFASDMIKLFSQLAQKKGIDFAVHVEEGVPDSIVTDEQKLKQIVKNLISNALKFTEEGSVKLNIKTGESKQIVFMVEDTGVGISREKQREIFEAFQQEDGTTSRKYGGTGLGLSISREYAKLLGGEIRVESEKGRGSIFRLLISADEAEKEEFEQKSSFAAATLSYEIEKSRIEESEEKRDFDTANEEVFFQTGINDCEISKNNCKSGIIVIDADKSIQSDVKSYISSRNPEICVDTADDMQQGYEMVVGRRYECIIAGVYSEDERETEILASIKADENAGNSPMIVYIGEEMPNEIQRKIISIADEVIVKSEKFKERLIDEIRLFLHSMEKKLNMKDDSDIISKCSGDQVFKDKKILIVDDDMRNVFAVSSILEEKQMNVVAASNGLEGIQMLESEPDVDLVIMDIMMPEMDGYEAMSRIRRDERYCDLPIIAFTAKAMKGDKSKCLEAGASDYLSKPIENEKLLSMVRMWLQK